MLTTKCRKRKKTRISSIRSKPRLVAEGRRRLEGGGRDGDADHGFRTLRAGPATPGGADKLAPIFPPRRNAPPDRIRRPPDRLGQTGGYHPLRLGEPKPPGGLPCGLLPMRFPAAISGKH